MNCKPQNSNWQSSNVNRKRQTVNCKLIIFLAFISGSLFAQQDAQYSMYHFNGLYLNPAYSGSHDILNATVIYRDQWVKMPGAPQTASVAINSPLKNDRIALGVIYTYDQIGVTKTNSLNADFAYRLPLGKNKKIRLCFGISAGFDNYRANLNGVAVVDANDPSFESNNQNRWLPNVGAGIYAYSDKFYAGISTPRILANKLNGSVALFATSTGVARQYQNLLITGGYVFGLSKKIKFVPSVLLKYVPGHAPLTFDFNAKFVFIDRIWIGAAYRFNDSYNFMLAVNIIKQLCIGYSYDLTVSPLSKFTTGSHEVMIGFDTDFKHAKDAPVGGIRYF